MANGKGWQRKYFIWSATSFERKFIFVLTKIFPDIYTRNIPTDIRDNAPFCGSASLPSPFSLAGTKYQNQTMVIRTHYDDDDDDGDDGGVDHGDEDDDDDDQNTLCAKEERTTMRAELLLSNGSKRLHIVVIIMINVIINVIIIIIMRITW